MAIGFSAVLRYSGTHADVVGDAVSLAFTLDRTMDARDRQRLSHS
ncbi:Uncharacterised protein [Vibrio cholerae]|nr:Uncharacterised protein [Vibrio cholerae]